MNQEKIGKFIAKCRKDKKMTQSELAEKLGVTDKSIGNWENGRNMPDLALFKPLCDELGITNLFQGVKDKVARLQSFLDEQNGEMSEVAYIGDDLNDLECIKIVRNEGGLTGSPFNAAREVRHAVNYKCKAKGGEGAVREFIEYILKKNDKIA
jgi:YrbI family 3-deoxy-D-manno-octulosonate 8-phosphate phosphatase